MLLERFLLGNHHSFFFTISFVKFEFSLRVMYLIMRGMISVRYISEYQWVFSLAFVMFALQEKDIHLSSSQWSVSVKQWDIFLPSKTLTIIPYYLDNTTRTKSFFFSQNLWEFQRSMCPDVGFVLLAVRFRVMVMTAKTLSLDFPPSRRYILDFEKGVYTPSLSLSLSF
jgi:hypothetical protein